MRVLSNTSIFCLSVLMGCSALPEKTAHVDHHSDTARYLASTNEFVNSQPKLKNKIDKLMDGIFQAYIIGQVHLHSFDAELDKDPSKAMKSDSYSSLLAVRTLVDSYEHQVNDLYISLVLVNSMPEYSFEQKMNAQLGLKAMGDYMEGLRSDKTKIHENLKPLVLSNLREKQSELFEDLKEIREKNRDQEVKNNIWKQMVNLRATRISFFKELKNYIVDKKVLAAALKAEKKKKSFQDLDNEVKALSKDIKALMSDIGRDTSADAITPSAGPNGNISGKTFPPKTWSLTYDDGPGKSTTEQVLKNLQDRKIPASFFVLAKQVEAYPAVAMKLKDAGMEIASHSYTHAQLTKVGSVQLEREIGTSKKVIEEKLDVKVRMFRLPYGAGVSVSNVRAKIAQHDMVHVFWTVDTLDWQDKNPQSIMNRTLKQMNASAKNAGIVLFHDIHPQSVIASTLLMDHFNKNDLTVCTVSGVVDQINQNLPSCK